MQRHNPVQRQSEPRPPWSPLSVALIALLLPPGGAVLTMRNLQRLGDIDDQSARWLTVAIVTVFALGYAALIVIATAQSTRTSAEQIDAGALTVLQFGVALASYVVQRLPYRQWRSAHLRTANGSLLSGLLVVAIYSFVSYVAAAFVSGALLGLFPIAVAIPT